MSDEVENIDPELAASLARFEASARAHPNFGRCLRKPRGEGRGARGEGGGEVSARARGECHRGMPPEREESEPEMSGGAVVGSSQAEFLSAVDVKVSDRVLLEFFREHYNEWIPMVKLAEVSGCHAVHSRIPEVRGLLPEDHDIDQESRLWVATGKAHSHYRLCLRSHSVRLDRERKRLEDERQQTF